MTSLITLPIRLSLELTARAAKLGVDALRAVTRLVEHDDADVRVRPVAHVDSEPILVYESGPADDVGAVVHVDAPWDGYDRMRATDIVARLRSADAATRAIVRLYEQQGKARSSVLAAAG
jgi:hypothetical protein